MNATTRLGSLCLLLAGCSGASFEEVIVQETPDASQLGSVAPPDAQAVGDGGAKEDAAEGSLEAGTEDAMCSVSWIPEGWTSSENCAATTDPGCPACLPYAYTCDSGTYYPTLFIGSGAVVSELTGNTCSSLPICVRNVSLDRLCSAETQQTKSQAYACALLVDGGLASSSMPLPGCITEGLVGGLCCP